MSRLTLHHRTNVNEAHAEQMTLGQKVADKVASGMGSWRFIIIQTALVVLWVVGNLWLLSRHPFDPYPFILLNLFFSTQASYAAPFIMMSQNRQAAKDRIAAEVDYAVNRKAEEHTEKILERIAGLEEKILTMEERIEEKLDAHMKPAPVPKRVTR